MEELRMPIKIIDEVSSELIYIGTSLASNPAAKFWQIKKIWKDGTQWKTGYPDGDQSRKYIWDNRLTYDYI